MESNVVCETCVHDTSLLLTNAFLTVQWKEAE